MSRGLIENPVIAFITVSWTQFTHHHFDSVFLYSSTSCTPASVIENLVWSYMWYGESTIIAIRAFHAFLRRGAYRGVSCSGNRHPGDKAIVNRIFGISWFR